MKKEPGVSVAAKNIGELMVRENLINIDQLEQAKKEQKTNGGKLGAALMRLGYIDEKKYSEFLSKQYSVPFIDLNTFDVDRKAIEMLSRKVCEKHAVIPLSVAGNTLVVAMSDPSNIFVLDDLTFLTKSKIQPLVAPESQIRKSIDKFYSAGVSYEDIMTEIEKETVIKEVDTEDNDDDNIVDINKKDQHPVVQFVNMMLTEAVKMGASDIHIEPYEKKFRIRFRIDGKLYEKIQPPQGIANAISSRIKIMSKLDIAERRRPQDGRIKIVTPGNKEMDFRVSILPALYGEKIVLRLLDKSNLQLDMTKLGFTEHQMDVFSYGIHKPFGMVLITGPTGSGKSTTIYSALAELNTPEVNISTAEDPVEYNLEGINQVQMNADINLNFAAALRSFLRQDPDIVMVGEIRDGETAEIAFKAALTGHLVVSTLHTNDSTSTIHRLIDMGIEPFLINSAINTIVAQRLVRKNCQYCKEPVHVSPDVLIDLGIPQEEIGTFEVMKGSGCSMCNDTGYKGRVAIYEILDFRDELKQAVNQGMSSLEFRKLAIQLGLVTLRMSGIDKLKQGLTSVEEVISSSAKD